MFSHSAQAVDVSVFYRLCRADSTEMIDALTGTKSVVNAEMVVTNEGSCEQRLSRDGISTDRAHSGQMAEAILSTYAANIVATP